MLDLLIPLAVAFEGDLEVDHILPLLDFRFLQTRQLPLQARTGTYAPPFEKLTELLLNRCANQKPKIAALTDAFYTLLMALDVAASLAGTQQHYHLTDGDGQVVSGGDGKLEIAAYSAFFPNG